MAVCSLQEAVALQRLHTEDCGLFTFKTGKNKMDKAFYKIFIIVFVIFSQGCGIYSFTGASIPPGAKTVSVDYFKNNAPIFNPTLSQEITEMLQDKLVSQTVLNLTDGRGDLQFKGEIVGYSSAPVSIVSRDNPTAAQNRLTIRVKVEFINELDESKSFNETFSRFYDYDATQNLSAAEGTAVPVIIELITDDIFNKAVVNW
ncbi:MAG: LptE family protein [Bacteroidota bacterium]